MKKKGTGFFSVDRRIWAKVCDLGMNEAVAYLVLACGTGGDNRSTSWSSTALHKYAGVTFERGVATIKWLVREGYILHARKHTKAKPRYRLTPWAEFMQRGFVPYLSSLTAPEKAYLDSLPNEGCFEGPDKRRKRQREWFESLVYYDFVWETGHGEYTRDLSPESDPIWLPNTIVTGTAKGEDSPIKRLRRSGDVWALRLFVDLYHSQNLRDDGGISPRVLRWNFSRKQIGQQGIHTIWAFKPASCPTVDRYTDLFSIHFHKDRKQPEETEHPFWVNVELLKKLGLIHFIPHLWESDSHHAEIIYPYGMGWSGEEVIERKLGESAHRAGCKMAFGPKRDEAANEGFHWFAPVPSTIPDCVLIGIARLRYRPHTKRTRAWYAQLHETGSELIRIFDNLSGISKLESTGCIKGNQSSSKDIKGVQGSSKKVIKTA